MANVPTVSLDETSPAGSQAISLGDNRIREFKTQVREIMEIDHKYESSGQDADMGKHKQCTFIEAADIGTGAEGLPILGGQTAGGKAELTFTDEDDNDIQITKAGALYLGDARLDNDSYLKAINNAGDGTVDLIKANTSDVAVLPDGSELATSAAPTADADIANKKYVDDTFSADDSTLEISGGNMQVKAGGLNATHISGILGTNDSDNVKDTSYEAATDIIITAYAHTSANPALQALTDSSDPPTTVVSWQNVYYPDGTGGKAALSFYCKKGNFWKITGVTGTLVINYVPIGS